MTGIGPGAVTWVTEIGFPAPDAGPLHSLFAPMPAPEPFPEPFPEPEPEAEL